MKRGKVELHIEHEDGATVEIRYFNSVEEATEHASTLDMPYTIYNNTKRYLVAKRIDGITYYLHSDKKFYWNIYNMNGRYIKHYKTKTNAIKSARRCGSDAFVKEVG